jgi:hypothetical protein
MNNPLETRNHLVERLERDLIGPVDPRDSQEVLSDYPSDKYVTGILFPRQLAIPQEEDDEMLPTEDDESSGNEAAVPLSQCVRPASAGISFTILRTDDLERSPEIFVVVQAAHYLKRWTSEGDETELTDNERRGKNNVRWQRVPKDSGPIPINLNFIGHLQPDPQLAQYGFEGLYLHVETAPNDRGLGVTVVLINSRTNEEDRDENERNTWFQTVLAIKPGKGCKFVGRPLRREAVTPDDQTAALIYRDFLEFAVGHTCSATWPSTDPVNQISTTWLPTRSVDAMSADGDSVFDPVRNHPTLKPFSAKWLATAEETDVLKALDLIPTAYNDWITARTGEIQSLPDSTLQSYARAHRELWIKARNRMISTLGWLRSNDGHAALQAFRLSNNAMQVQRRWSRDEDLYWRPFQIAFQLLVLESVLRKDHPDRSIMDLLWFPTGGGKTEAYLGVIAMVLFYRRLSGEKPDDGAGVNVIMRYTLRVLTTQQFQRAAFLICACEKIRIEKNLPGGSRQFSIGLWVGGNATPNSVAEAHNDTKRAMQIDTCPCCKKRLSIVNDESRFAIQCIELSCFFGKSGKPLPIWTIDDDVYRELPSLVIGTIDKFAQIARNRKTAGLFGIDTPHLPPDLIIQDELHLISGPLGTIAGLYEIAIDAFCSSPGSIPKIIGSTATIKMAGQQVRALFNRHVFQFPPPGLNSTNSCFAVRDEKKTGRLYLGVTTAGRSSKFTLQAVCASLLQAASSPLVPEALKDSYWTLVAYFNALRELGGAHVLMLDDVPKSIGEYALRHREPPRKLIEPAELTSRLSQAEIPEVLDRLSMKRETNRAEDALLSTNMISVGVDIPRLALMVVNGQPKAISEYIQATSRVGRDVVPGLVVTVFNNGKPRDRSHYETFSTWHATLYRDIEATSVTPFAARAVDKALRAVFVAMVRHLVPSMRNTPVLSDSRRPGAERIRDLIVQRAKAIDNEESASVATRLDITLDEWQGRMGLEEYWVDNRPGRTLLMSAERVAAIKAANLRQSSAWSAPNSMREVEPSTHFRLPNSD